MAMLRPLGGVSAVAGGRGGTAGGGGGDGRVGVMGSAYLEVSCTGAGRDEGHGLGQARGVEGERAAERVGHGQGVARACPRIRWSAIISKAAGKGEWMEGASC